jgi:hypothetical protein
MYPIDLPMVRMPGRYGGAEGIASTLLATILLSHPNGGRFPYTQRAPAFSFLPILPAGQKLRTWG